MTSSYKSYTSNWFDKNGKLNFRNYRDFQSAFPSGSPDQLTQGSYVTDMANNILAANGLKVMGNDGDSFRPAIIQHDLNKPDSHRVAAVDDKGGITFIDYTGDGKNLKVGSVNHFNKEQIIEDKSNGAISLHGEPTTLELDKKEIASILSVPNKALDTQSSMGGVQLASGTRFAHQYGSRVSQAAEIILGNAKIAKYQSGGGNVASLQVGKIDGKESGEFRLVVQDADGKFTTASFNAIKNEIEWKKGQALEQGKLTGGENFLPTDKQSEAFKSVVNERIGGQDSKFMVGSGSAIVTPAKAPAPVNSIADPTIKKTPTASPALIST